MSTASDSLLEKMEDIVTRVDTVARLGDINAEKRLIITVLETWVDNYDQISSLARTNLSYSAAAEKFYCFFDEYLPLTEGLGNLHPEYTTKVFRSEKPNLIDSITLSILLVS